MTDDKPTRRDLMKPVQLLGLAFGAALFAGIVTLVSMGFFQRRSPEQAQAALQLALIVAGITFIVVLRDGRSAAACGRSRAGQEAGRSAGAAARGATPMPRRVALPRATPDRMPGPPATPPQATQGLSRVEHPPGGSRARRPAAAHVHGVRRTYICG